jgi:chromosomal replication initiation ATPase DnaA
MSYAMTQTAARHITRAAEQQIRTKTGMRVTLVLCPSDNPLKSPEQMLRVVARSLNTSPEVFQEKNRKRQVVEVRFVAALLLRYYYPTITLKQIGLLFGGQDHTSIMNALTRAQNLLYTNDVVFTAQYKHALNTVNQWINE